MMLRSLACLLFASGAAAFSVPASHADGLHQTQPLGTTSLRHSGIASPPLHDSPSFSTGSIFAVSAACGLAAALLRSQAGAKKSQNRSVVMRAEADAKQYWEGEWICADCGYIYNERTYGSKFEELQVGFKCPACAAPRRRFARKLGDKIGTTLDGGDAPILLFSALCFALVLGIAYFALQ
eukprot:TRINITY_DN9947_c3_g1_i1.p1 TRINITY_DN9947_c3_g1~~TRINITY_DN9947_c3_g1_i1.p1  ORF type:complete len:181 (+),score=32.98 TRINITY_DN9947_c3_g1_i1:90-632(+)